MIDRISRRAFVAGAAAIAASPPLARLASASSTGALQIPDTPLGAQIAWALGLFTGKPTGLTDADVKAHFSDSVLGQVPAPALVASLDKASAQLGPLTTVGYVSQPTDAGAVIEVVAAGGQRLELVIAIDQPSNLISILNFRAMTQSATPTASPVAATVAMPDTPVGNQLSWLLGLLTGAPVSVSDAEIADRFSSYFLRQVGASELRASFNQMSVGEGPVTVVSFVAPPTATSAVAIVAGKSGTRYEVSISVEVAAPHQIVGLRISPVAVTQAAPSWDAFANTWSGLAADSSFYVEERTTDGGIPVAGANETAPLALGSTFKLYVLGALVLAIEANQASWDDKLAIRDDWKSLPSGTLQNEPAGTEFTLREYAEKMISISDNTAADHLLLHLGRNAVTTAMSRMGHANPRANVPFLTTRELFALKLVADRATLDQYLAADSLGRVGMLPAIDALTPTLAEAVTWTTPRYIRQIEWFASSNDLANAMAWLANVGTGSKLAPALEILAINPGVPLDAKTWTFIGYKGGSEPGVLNLTWLLKHTSGRTFVVTGTLNDPNKPIDTQPAIDSITEAINLLAKSI
jgi:beta-lactamase class A